MKEKSISVVSNMSWILVCHIAQVILSFLVTILTARHLGPSNFGLINYAASLVAFVMPVTKLGLDSVLVQEFINEPDKESEILGTALVMNSVAAVFGMAAVILFCVTVNPGEKDTLIVCALYSLVLFAEILHMIIYWFQAKLMSKYSALVSLAAYVIVSLYKIYLLSFGKNVYWFAISNALDVFIIGLVLHILFRKLSGSRLTFSKIRMKRMFTKSKYYIISSLTVILFSQTDRIMLKNMIGDVAVGCYTAAVSCAGITSFVFSALIQSMRPVILESKNHSQEVYELHIKQLYSLIVYGALSQSFIITLFAKGIVGIVYGAGYADAVGVLQVIVWYTTFSYYGGAKDIWILAEGKQKYLLSLNCSGAVMNIVLNYLLIPVGGVVGAAIASLITQIFTNIIMGMVIRELRSNNRLLLQSLNPKYLRDMITILMQVISRKIHI